MSAQNPTLNYSVPDDGVKFKATINPKKRIHDGIVFFYRPIDAVERKSCGYRINVLNRDEKFDQSAWEEVKQVLERIESWNMAVPVDDFIARKAKLSPAIFQDIYNVVWGYEAADELEIVTKNS